MGNHLTKEIYSNEEFANAFSHGIGLILALLGSAVLLSYALNEAATAEAVGIFVFCFSLVLVYATSTAYHSVPWPSWKGKLQIADHISIYFLIAGTHTPFLIYFSNGPNSQFYLILLWGLVLVGIIYKLLFFGKYKIISVLFYLGMGWMAVFTLPPIMDQMPGACLNWIITGGVFYTVGVLFFLWTTLSYHHMIWHLFVMGGSFAHFMAILYIV